MTAMITMTVVTMMHEKVHQRARQKEKKGQRAEQVGRVFGHKIEAGHGQEPK
jgi:hypothetical protein